MLANLKALRTAQGLSQRALADFVKVSQQSINQYENRDTEPDIAVLTRIADYFGVSIDYLVGHDPAAGELIPTNLTDAELRLILNFRQLDDDQQRSMNLLVMQMTKDNKRNAKPQELVALDVCRNPDGQEQARQLFVDGQRACACVQRRSQRHNALPAAFPDARRQ